MNISESSSSNNTLYMSIDNTKYFSLIDESELES